MILNCTNQSRELPCITERSGLDGLKYLCQIGIKSVAAIVVRVTQIIDVFSEVAEQEDVVFSNLTSDFDLRRVSLIFHSIRYRHGETNVCTIAGTDN